MKSDFAFIYKHVCTHTHVFAYTHHLHIYMYTQHTHVPAYIFVHTHVLLNMCMCVHMYTHTHTRRWQIIYLLGFFIDKNYYLFPARTMLWCICILGQLIIFKWEKKKSLQKNMKQKRFLLYSSNNPSISNWLTFLVPNFWWNQLHFRLWTDFKSVIFLIHGALSEFHFVCYLIM